MESMAYTLVVCRQLGLTTLAGSKHRKGDKPPHNGPIVYENMESLAFTVLR